MRRHRHLLACLLLLCSCTDDAAPAQQDADIRGIGSVTRLFGKLVEKLDEMVRSEPLEMPDEAGADWEPPLIAISSAADIDFDGALIGTRPGDPMATQGCVYLTEPGYFPPQSTLDDLPRFAVHDGTAEPDDSTLYFFVNGIRTSAEDHCEALRRYAEVRPGHAIVGVYNATAWGGVKDLGQAVLDRFTVKAETTLAKFGGETLGALHKNKTVATLERIVVERLSSDRPMRIMAHSQGGAITSLATHRAMDELIANGVLVAHPDGGYQIDRARYNWADLRVVSMGSAAPKWPPIIDNNLQDEWGGNATFKHVVHVRDLTPAAFGVSAWNWSADGGARSGAEFAMVFYDNGDNGDWVTLHAVSKDYRALEEGVAVWFFSDPNGTWQGDVADTHSRMPEVGYTDLAATANHGILDYITAVWQPPPRDRTCYWVEATESYDCDPGCRFDYDVERVLCDAK